MPTYEYACAGCGNRYEKRESFDAPARQKCPKCRKVAVRLISAPAVVFKGSGFYKTDSRGKDTAAEPAAAPAAAAVSDAGHGHGPGDHTHSAPDTAAAKTDGAASPAASPPASTKPEAAAAS